MEAASTMEEKIQVERALSKAMAAPKQAQSREHDAAMAGTHDIQRQDPALGDSCNLQMQGPAIYRGTMHSTPTGPRGRGPLYDKDSGPRGGSVTLFPTQQHSQSQGR